jgi:hypothetical protein
MLMILSLASAIVGHVQAQQTQTITDAQLQECRNVMFQVDVDDDGRVNRAEYINMLTALSPYSAVVDPANVVAMTDNCPDVGTIEDFLGDAPLSIIFEDFSCLCLTLSPEEGPDCCKGQDNMHLKVPLVFSLNYTLDLCTAIYDTIEDECTTAAPTISAAPSLTPSLAPSSTPTVSSAPSGEPSSAPSLVPSSVPSFVPTSKIIEASKAPAGPRVTTTGVDDDETNRNGNDDDDDDMDLIRILIPSLLGGLLLCLLVGLFLYYRKQRQSRNNSADNPKFADLQDNGSSTDMGTDNQDMAMFSTDKDGFVTMKDHSSGDGDVEQGSNSYPAAAAKKKKKKGEPMYVSSSTGESSSEFREPAPFDNRHHNLALELDLERDVHHSFNDDDDEQSGSPVNAYGHLTSVGSLTWSGGDMDLDSHDSSSDDAEDDDDDDDGSTPENIEKSYTSDPSDSREVAINAIIDQTKSGAEWFDFELPSSDSDTSDSDDDDHSHAADDDADADDEVSDDGESYRLEDGLDPEDAAKLEAILLENNVNL